MKATQLKAEGKKSKLSVIEILYVAILKIKKRVTGFEPVTLTLAT
jgi:hypothetical protein